MDVTYCYEVVFCIFCFAAFSIAAVTVEPNSLNTTSNSVATFSCSSPGATFLFFKIDEIPVTQDVNANRGLTEGIQTIINGTLYRNLTVEAKAINNNTNISCTSTHGTDVITSEPSFLMIQGLLDSVVDLDYSFINGSSVLLTWTAPYTLDNVPITGYYILNGLVNITTTNNNTNITLSATNPDPCILNNVSVSPINDVGIGSSNNISFYYETVLLVTPNVSAVVSVFDGQQILIDISINVSVFCKGEYPNNITVNILNTDNTVINNTRISTKVNNQLMITGVITVPNNLNTFIVNVSLSNNGGEFPPVPLFGFGFLGPVINIDSSIDNCSTIDVIWTAPTVDDRVSIQYYILRIYDAITGSLVDTVSVYNTSYRFVNNNLFIHRYTYVITGVNELGEGISNNDTFSYQRVPRSTTANTSLDILSYTQDMVIIQFYIPILLECVGEAPEHVTVTVLCNGTDSSTTYQIRNMNDITGLISVPQYQQCNISIVFSNEAGSSEPFILAFDTNPPSPNITNITTTTVQTSPTSTPVSTSFNISIVIITSISLGAVILLLLTCLIVFIIMYKRKLCRLASLVQQQQEVPTARNEAYEFNTFMINNNPAYEEIGRGGAVDM